MFSWLYRTRYTKFLSNYFVYNPHVEKDAAIANETERLHNECKVLKIEVKELQAELQATRVCTRGVDICI